MAEKIEIKVSKKKLETVKRLVELIKNNDTIIIASIKNLPSRQFQDIRKRLKGKADVIVVKKRIILKALETSGKKLDKLKEHIQKDSAILFSKLDSFELASFLAQNKNPIGAKSGQEAIEDIEIEEGGTDLLPGPAITEFGNLGIKIAVEEGKIAIKEKKVIVKAGEKVNEAAASIMSKLDIKPFKIGLEPIILYEAGTGKLYEDVKIDREKAVEDLVQASSKGLGLAQKIVYYCKETIGYLLAKANSEAGAVGKLQPAEPKEEPVEEKKEETEKTETTEEAKQEENKEENVQQENKSEEEK
jgi:large subunit ribosomal protein L10